MKCSIPASLASSNTYWISGLSTMVSISLGIALVAGRTRVPRPATGKTALRIFINLFATVAGPPESQNLEAAAVGTVTAGGEPMAQISARALLVAGALLS